MTKPKTKSLNTLLFSVLLILYVKAQNTINEKHAVVLDEEYEVLLKWRIDGDDIFIEMSAKTQGYVAIGFSPNGGMPGSDIVAGWVKDGKAFLSDRHAITYSKPNIDSSEDYELLYGYENGGKTTIGFKRKLETCDTNDYTITTDTARIIWALNDNDPANQDDLMYHLTSRGVRSVLLLNAKRKLRELPADAGFFDINMPNVTVPDDEDTTYWCTAFEVPQFERPVHVIRYDALVQEGHEAVVHHMLVYGCRGNLSTVRGWSDICERENMPPDLSNCWTVIYAWAIGGGSFEFPDHAGFPLGGENDPTFLYIEMHYDNPAFSSGKENGLSEDVYVFAVMLHGHIAAQQITLQQYRDGKLIDEIRDDNYDFNLQETRVVVPERTFKPGDAYVVTCTYNTVGRENITVGGEGTSEEMCVVFLFYYPSQPDLAYCLSASSFESIFETFEIPYNTDAEEEIFGYTYRYLTTQVNSENLRNGLRVISNTGKRYNYCYNDRNQYIGGDSFELNSPDWFNASKRIVPPSDVCNVDLPIGNANTLRAGYFSYVVMIFICMFM
ncbi:DBH-like monooxygenase protein 1 [Anneissia japonica]|uniref:DBH-like monooxygenase protein 1 n=1 Tax=Anneissia japonica TaxID=1529436 RepID=UPI001425B711|nr:DBH-like monooxygenase protein 1 [Anneissia japonica]